MFSLFKEICLIAALTFIGAAFSLYHEWAPQPWAEPKLAAGEIQLADAQVLDAIWFDARPREAFEDKHIPGALFYDDTDWDGSLLRLMDAWLTQPRPIIVYCGSESCGTSRSVAERLRDALPDAEIYSLKGGWDAWVE
jgi:3-mercaptopyruvate sulfurtransferase SseA